MTSEYKITPKELFNNLYDEYNGLSRVKRRKAIIAAMCPYFKNEEYTAQYVDKHLARKLNNLVISRYILR